MTESTLKQILNFISEAIVVIDSSGVVIFCSSRLAEFLKCSEEFILGKSFVEFGNLIARQFRHPDVIVQRISRIVEHPEDEWSCDLDLLNGEICSTKTLALNEGDRFFGRLISFSIGPAKTISSKDMWIELFNAAPFGIVHYAISGKISHANPALVQLFGYESESEFADAVNQVSVVDTLFQNRQIGVELEKRSMTSRGQWILEEVTFCRKDGSIFEGEIFLRANQGKTISFQGFVRDISSRKKSEKDLNESQKRLHSSFQLLKDLVNAHSDAFERSGDLESHQSLPQASRLFEMNYIESALRKTKGKVQPAARILGMSRYALIRQIAKMGIDPKKFR